MAKGIIYVETMPVSPDREAEYHKWYNDTHLAADPVGGRDRLGPPIRADRRRGSVRRHLRARLRRPRAPSRPGDGRTGKMTGLDNIAMDPKPIPQGVPRDRVARTVTLPADVQKRIYALMVLMKAADDRLSKGIGTGEFMCVYWPSRGQEAIAAAMGVTLRDDDQLVTTYRGLHDLIGKGVPLEEIYGEMMGRTVGASRGKGGTMHIAKPEKGVMLSTGIVGAGPPVGVGLAMAAKRKGLDRVTVVSFGDGATNTGSFHEAANMAALWDLPMVFVCQNNLYAEMTPTVDTMKIEHVADRAAGYGMPGVQRRRQRPACGRGCARRGDRQGPQRRRSDLHRVRDVPFPRPLLRRPDALHPQGTTGGGDGRRPGARDSADTLIDSGVCRRRRAQRHRRGCADRGGGGLEDGPCRRARRRSTNSTTTCTPPRSATPSEEGLWTRRKCRCARR